VAWHPNGLVDPGLILSSLRASFPSVPDAPGTAALLTIAMGALGGAVVLRHVRVARDAWRSVRVRVTRRRRRATLSRPRAERAELCDAVLRMADGLPPPRG
jgi:hypothetical protein